MKRDNLVLILSSMMALVGLVTGGAGLLLVAKNYRVEYELEELRGSMEEVAVARRPLEAGTRLKREDIALRLMPRRYMPSNPVFARDLEIYVGMPISEPLRGDELILTSYFASSGGEVRACECAEPGARVKGRARGEGIIVMERAVDE